jgi:hypothetical protein
LEGPAIPPDHRRAEGKALRRFVAASGGRKRLPLAGRFRLRRQGKDMIAFIALLNY